MPPAQLPQPLPLVPLALRHGALLGMPIVLPLTFVVQEDDVPALE